MRPAWAAQDGDMINAEQTRAHLATLNESIAQDVRDLASAKPADRGGILQHMRWCADELATLAQRLEDEGEDEEE